MIIILEGPDGTGKTTLAKQLAKQTGYALLSNSYPRSEEEKLAMVGTYLQTIRSGKNLILDRCWISEMVYGPLMRNEQHVSYTAMYDLEKLLAKAGSIIIYCTGPKAALWKRCQSRGEDYITSRELFDKICTEYDNIFDIPHLVPIVKYEYQDV